MVRWLDLPRQLGHGLQYDFLLADDVKLEKGRFPQPAVFTGLPPRDSWGVSRDFETLGPVRDFLGRNGEG